jgi:hypothetical protein
MPKVDPPGSRVVAVHPTTKALRAVVDRPGGLRYDKDVAFRSAAVCPAHVGYGPVAQLGARMNGIHEVTGSIPVWSTTLSFPILISRK